ncbi:mobilization protein, partial [Escherichia coli]|nr:mobilization protein [Escherichia coli]
TKLNRNKIVEIIKFLTNKRMVVQESRGIYRFMPDYHY